MAEHEKVGLEKTYNFMLKIAREDQAIVPLLDDKNQINKLKIKWVSKLSISEIYDIKTHLPGQLTSVRLNLLVKRANQVGGY